MQFVTSSSIISNAVDDPFSFLPSTSVDTIHSLSFAVLKLREVNVLVESKRILCCAKGLLSRAYEHQSLMKMMIAREITTT